MSDWLLVDGARRLLADTCGYEAVEQAEAEGWSAAVWEALHGAGYASLSELELDDALSVLVLAGEHAAPVPLAEAALAGWIVGEPVPGPVSVAPAGELRLEGGRLSGTARLVPWGGAVERIVAVLDAQAVVVPVAAAVGVEHRANLAGEPRDTLHFELAEPQRSAPVAGDLLELGALTRAALIAGALAAMARLTVAYAAQRRQFGRPIASFQAVQQHLVAVAQEAAVVGAAVEGAARRPGSFEIAAAKTLASRSALAATRAAHQVHGAMGMTREYRLHHLSRRLWAWRCEYGDEQLWAERLGGALAAAGAGRLYPAITSGSAAI